jgi:hypothetical protein
MSLDLTSNHQRWPIRDALRRAWRRGRSTLPKEGFVFGRPLVVLQSDDWGRAGMRDIECWEQLRTAGVNLGEHPYDFYSLETTDDVEGIASVLNLHRDSSGRPACFEMNFLSANVDFARVSACDLAEILESSRFDGGLSPRYYFRTLLAGVARVNPFLPDCGRAVFE